jgi:hypothetical protein
MGGKWNLLVRILHKLFSLGKREDGRNFGGGLFKG